MGWLNDFVDNTIDSLADTAQAVVPIYQSIMGQTYPIAPPPTSPTVQVQPMVNPMQYQTGTGGGLGPGGGAGGAGVKPETPAFFNTKNLAIGGGVLLIGIFAFMVFK